MSTSLISADVSTALFTATTTAKSVNDPCLITNIVGIAKVAIAANTTGSAFINGRHSFAKGTTKNMDAGEIVFMNFTTKKVTAWSTGNTRCGRAYAAYTTSETPAQFFLNMPAP
jgi:predicted RecA/RadA family phage recombinase